VSHPQGWLFLYCNAKKIKIYFANAACVAELQKPTLVAHTVMIIIADHGHKLPATGRVPDDFKIPCFGWVVRYPNTKDL